MRALQQAITCDMNHAYVKPVERTLRSAARLANREALVEWLLSEGIIEWDGAYAGPPDAERSGCYYEDDERPEGCVPLYRIVTS